MSDSYGTEELRRIIWFATNGVASAASVAGDRALATCEERDALRAQLADAERVIEAARQLEHHDLNCARYLGAPGFDACDCLLGPILSARDAYDAKWRAGK